MVGHWFRRWIPRSLFGRALLILVVPIFTLQLVVSVSFIQRHFEGVTQQMTSSVLLELRYLLQEIEAARSPAEAEMIATAIGAPLSFDVVLPVADAPDDDLRRFYDLSGIVVLNSLGAGLPELRATHLLNDREVELWLETGFGLMQVSFDRIRLSASNPHQLLVLMIVLGVVMTLIAYVFLRNQIQPISVMASAATEYGRGRLVSFQPSGATEIRAAGMAFLDMRARIERQTQTRTLMLSGVSHDLRTPLTRLRLGLSLLDDADTGPLIGDVDDMQHLLDTFLDFARDEAEDEVDLVDPADLVSRIVADCQRGGQAVRLVVADGAPVDDMQLRPMAIRRALENLIGNALRYGSTALVTIRASEKALLLTVEDDGPGIAPDRRDEAMRPFSRLDPARNQDRGSGVGLGLAIVNDVARAHGGTVRLGESAGLGGLSVELILPR